MRKIYTLEEFKKLPSAKNKGIPTTIWAATGATRGSGMKDGDDLRGNLAEGMKEIDIEKLNESPQGRAVRDDYLNNRSKRNKEVKEATDGVFDKMSPSGNMERDYVADHHTGNLLPENINE